MSDNEQIRVEGSDGQAIIAGATAATAGVVTLKTWECKPCKTLVLQGESCPTCDKQLLLG